MTIKAFAYTKQNVLLLLQEARFVWLSIDTNCQFSSLPTLSNFARICKILPETPMHIRPVQIRKDLTAFINLPYQLYRHDPVWVPPLRDEQRGQFDPQRNPLLDHCEWQLFLLEDNGKLIGRIAAFIDLLAVDFWKERIGLFGYYECASDPAAALALLEAARDWLRTRDRNLHARALDVRLTRVGAGGGRLHPLARGHGSV